MKRVLLIVVAVLVLLVAAVGGIFASAFAGNAPLPETGPIAGGKAILVKDGFVSLYVVPIGDGHAIAIDSGADKEAKALDDVLAREKLTLVAFFITHGHGDHVGGCLRFPRARVYALADEVDLIEGRKGSDGPMGKLMGANSFSVKVTDRLSDGQVVPVGSKSVRVFAVPGHTKGSAAYLVDGVLFFGDIAGHTTKDQVKRAPWVFSDDTAQAAESIRALAQKLLPEEVQAFAFAHSGPLVPADLKKLADVD